RAPRERHVGDYAEWRISPRGGWDGARPARFDRWAGECAYWRGSLGWAHERKRHQDVRDHQRSPCLRRETMNDLDDERPVERAGQGPGVREAKPSERLSSVPGVPHHEHVVPDHRNPVEPHVEVDTLALVVVLDEREHAGAGI